MVCYYVDFPEVTQEFAISQQEKLVMKWPLTLQIHEESYKYDPELLLSSWSFSYPLPQLRGVTKSLYCRNEQILCKLRDYETLRKWKEAFDEASFHIDLILKGVIP